MTWLATLDCGHAHGPIDDRWEGPPPRVACVWWCRWPCVDVAFVTRLEWRELP